MKKNVKNNASWYQVLAAFALYCIVSFRITWKRVGLTSIVLFQSSLFWKGSSFPALFFSCILSILLFRTLWKMKAPRRA